MRFAATAMAISVGIIGCALAGDVRASIKKPTDIPSQPLGSALQVLAKERDFQIIYIVDLLAGVQTRGAHGQLTTEEALKELLSGTGVTYRYLDNQTVTILPVSETSPTPSVSPHVAADGSRETSGSQGEGQRSLWDRFRVAQVDQRAPAHPSSVEESNRADSDPNFVKLEEVVVTAQKREERLIDVPISIVALSADELQNRKLTSLSDLQFAVPGMGITSSDGVANTIELRGVSNPLGISPLVGMYIDEVDVTNSGGSQINPNTYDLERVEVLRGPQGTLYGEGSAGGTIRFITKSPVLDRFGMTANVASLFTQDGSPGERINTAINVPLIDQELAVRIVGAFDREGGWIDEPAAGLKDINGQDLTNVRIKGLWQPLTQFSASFMAELYRDGRSIGAGEDARGNFTQVFNLTTTPKVSENHDIYNLTLIYDFAAAKILNSTSYLREKIDATNQGISYDYLGSTPYDYLSPYQLRNDHAWVEELRLSSNGSGPWQWTVGGFYRRYRNFTDSTAGYFGQLGQPGAALPTPSGASMSNTLFKSWSAFGDINYKLWERFTLGFGVRSFHENQDYFQIQDYGSGPIPSDQRGTFHSVDPRLYAEYQLGHDINIYASAAKGFRSGGFNQNIAHPTFAPEAVRTYELGTKMSLLEGQLHAQTAIFYTDYKDYVVSGVQPGEQFFAYFNDGNARIRGVEWDFAWRPGDQWSVGINGNYYDSQFTKITATATPYEVGDPLDLVPKYQITSYAERDFTWSGKQLAMRLDYTRRGRMTFRDRTVGLYRESDVINLLGYYLNLHWSPSLSFNLFAQNLLNDRGLISPSLGAPVRSRPRTYGVGFDVAFN